MLRETDPTITAEQYLEGFTRQNLFKDAAESPQDAANRFWANTLPGDRVIVLGRVVARSLGIVESLLHPRVIRGVEFRQIPHPSGLNRHYNSIVLRRMVGLLLLDSLKGETDE